MLFWIALGLVCAASIWLSVAAVALVTLAMIIPAWMSGRGREALTACRWALSDGARQALPVGLACALVGISACRCWCRTCTSSISASWRT